MAETVMKIKDTTSLADASVKAVMFWNSYDVSRNKIPTLRHRVSFSFHWSMLRKNDITVWAV